MAVSRKKKREGGENNTLVETSSNIPLRPFLSTSLLTPEPLQHCPGLATGLSHLGLRPKITPPPFLLCAWLQSFPLHLNNLKSALKAPSRRDTQHEIKHLANSVMILFKPSRQNLYMWSPSSWRALLGGPLAPLFFEFCWRQEEYPFPYLFVKSNPVFLKVASCSVCCAGGGGKPPFNPACSSPELITRGLLKKASLPARPPSPRRNIRFLWDMLW